MFDNPFSCPTATNEKKKTPRKQTNLSFPYEFVDFFFSFSTFLRALLLSLSLGILDFLRFVVVVATIVVILADQKKKELGSNKSKGNSFIRFEYLFFVQTVSCICFSKSKLYFKPSLDWQRMKEKERERVFLFPVFAASLEFVVSVVLRHVLLILLL